MLNTNGQIALLNLPMAIKMMKQYKTTHLAHRKPLNLKMTRSCSLMILALRLQKMRTYYQNWKHMTTSPHRTTY